MTSKAADKTYQYERVAFYFDRKAFWSPRLCVLLTASLIAHDVGGLENWLSLNDKRDDQLGFA